jgi:hypothetical protein
MHSILFAATVPDRNLPHAEHDKWRGFSDYASNKLELYTNVERLAENVWLVNLLVDPAPLGFLVAGAEEHQVAYRLLPFDVEPQWLPAAMGPKTIPAHNA